VYHRLLVLLALIAGVANARPVTLVWDPPVGYSPTGYVVGYGEVSGAYSTIVDVGNTQVYTVADLVAGRTYHFSVKAHVAGESSAWANELVVAVLNDPPPPSVSVSPVVGLWDNRDEPGTGYSLDFKHGVLVVLIFTYTASGAPQWYIASGPLIGSTFTGRLDKFVGGPCISCAFAGGPTAAGSDGAITIVFSSPTAATVSLPAGRTTEIRPTAF
jgi:hypothetical protein